MNIKDRIRRAVVAVALASSVATAIGAAGAAHADTDVPADPPTTEVPSGPPAEEVPPAEDAPPGPEAGGAETPPAPTEPTTPPAPTEPTTPPAPTEPPTPPAPTTVPAQSGKPPVTTPPSAIATPTTTTPNEVVATVTAATAATAPQSLVATPANGSVQLKWLAPSSDGGAPIGKYAVQRYNPAKSAWENIAFPTGFSYTNSPLTNGTKYSFRILAHNSAGWSAPSTVVSAIPRTVPSAPTSPVATPGNASVKLTWKQPASNGGATVDKYEVQRYMPGGSWTTIATPTTLSYPAGGLLNGITYSFRIRAHNAAGWGPFSTVVKAVPRTVPDAPFAVQAKPSDGYVGLTWSAPPSGGAAIDNYRVQIATSLAGPWTTYVGVNGALAQGGIGGLTNGTTYYFKVGAHNAVGWGQYSWAINAVPRTVPSAPGLTANPETPNWVKLNWTRPAQNGGVPIESYRFEQATDPGGPWTLAATMAVPADKASGYAYVGGLKPGTTYYFRAAAVNAAGQGPYNSIAVSVTTPATVPGAPTGCTAYQTSYNTMYIDWNAPTSDGGSPIINYNVLIEKGQWKYQVVSSDWDHVEGYWYWDTISIVGHDTVASITARTAVVSPGAYKIVIRARNSMGYGPLCETYVEII